MVGFVDDGLGVPRARRLSSVQEEEYRLSSAFDDEGGGDRLRRKSEPKPKPRPMSPGLSNPTGTGSGAAVAGSLSHAADATGERP